MHKRIGIIGGLSPESTVSYYLHITRAYVQRYGDYGYPEILIYSVNLQKFHEWRTAGRWDLVAGELIRCVQKITDAGAQFGLIATNTMHKVFDPVQEAVDLPLIHVIDATAQRAREHGLSRLGLLGTQYTMDDGFYQERMEQNGLQVLVPGFDEQQRVHEIIVQELVRGRIEEASRITYIRVIEGLIRAGAEGIVLGCTEIPLLIRQEDSAAPLLDTAAIHADAALEYALGET